MDHGELSLSLSPNARGGKTLRRMTSGRRYRYWVDVGWTMGGVAYAPCIDRWIDR